MHETTFRRGAPTPPTMIFLVAALLICAASAGAAAGKSDVADAVMKGDTASLRTLIEHKADVNAPQVDDATALHWAVHRDNGEAADLLIKAGAKIDIANREGVTPLAMASLYGSAAMVDRLLSAGANAKQRGPNGETMLMFAARNGNPVVIKRLAAAGADVNARESLRGTPRSCGRPNSGIPTRSKCCSRLEPITARSPGPRDCRAITWRPASTPPR